jgi:hypothetical protein
MKLAWLTHREWGRTGGAEICDYDMAMRRPDGVEPTIMFPGGVDEDLYDFDKVLVTGFYGFSARELNLVQDVGHKTAMWLHDSQMQGHWLYEVVKDLIFVTPMHEAHDLKGVHIRGATHVNPGWMDIEEIYALGGPRKDALWAHRPVGHKGLDLAVEWALAKGVQLDVLVGRPREEILEAMAAHKYFVLLSHIFDSGPRAVMEAQLLGCEIVINDEVGWFNESPEELAARLQRADKEFWEVVLS